MGAWGYKLYENDAALDIEAVFEEEYEEGKNIKEIEKKVKEEFTSMLDEEDDEATNFWSILADLECKYGVLTEETKKKALELIKSGREVEFWKEASSEKLAKKREEVLKELVKKIEETEIK